MSKIKVEDMAEVIVEENDAKKTSKDHQDRASLNQRREQSSLRSEVSAKSPIPWVRG